MTDRPILDHINALANEEAQLWERASAGGGLGTADQERLDTIKVELDRCYDLLHQRQARGDGRPRSRGGSRLRPGGGRRALPAVGASAGRLGRSRPPRARSRASRASAGVDSLVNAARTGATQFRRGGRITPSATRSRARRVVARTGP